MRDGPENMPSKPVVFDNEILFLSKTEGVSPYTIKKFLDGGVDSEYIQGFLEIIECFSDGMGKRTIADRRETGKYNSYQANLTTLISAYHQYGGRLEELQILFESVIGSIGEGPVSEEDGRGQKIYDRALRVALGLGTYDENGA